MIHPPPEPARELAPLVPRLPADIGRWARETAQIALLTVALYLVLSTFVTQPFEVELQSMEPTLIGGDHILVDKVTPLWTDIERGDVVVFDAPAPYDDDAVPYVKRVIGVAGDTIELLNGRVYVTPAGGFPTLLDEDYLPDGLLTLPKGAASRTWVVPLGSVFVLGDNRPESVDSRTFGPIELDHVIGRAWLRYLPLDRISLLGRSDELDVASRLAD